MQIQTNVPLSQHSTMRLGGMAQFFVTIESEDDLLEALHYAKDHELKTHILGQGSNTIFSQNGFSGLIIQNKLLGISENESEDTLQIEVGAGENWDNVVARSVSRGYFDIAALSLIPGTTGAAPVQNIGAYGQQISDTIQAVRVYDLHDEGFKELKHEECSFFYRGSRFNTDDKGKFIVTKVIMRLNRKKIIPPFYDDVSQYFAEHGIDENTVTPSQLRTAVSTVRVIKLPDPREVSNCGSFFKNPIVTPETYESLKQTFPELKAHQTDDGQLKLYGAQLIELAGMKDFHDQATGMATWKNQALVLVNESANKTEDLLQFKDKIVDAVKDKFGITLIQEPEYVQ